MSAFELLTHVFGDEHGIVGTFSGSRTVVGAKTLDTPRSAYFRWPHEVESALECLRDEDRRYRETYFCAHLLKAERRIKANAAPLLSCYVDGDGAKPGLSIPSPTATVESSPGREQFYWRLTRPVAPEFGESLNRRLALAMGGDRSGWDLTQLLRPPETRNYKYPDTPPVVLRDIADVAYDPDELDRLLPLTPAEGPCEARYVRPPESIGSSPDLSRLSRRMQDLVTYGNHGEYRTRSDADFAVCIAMFGAGYEASEVWAVITDPKNGISEKFFEKGRDGERYLALTIGKAEALANVSRRARRGRVYARRREAIRLG